MLPFLTHLRPHPCAPTPHPQPGPGFPLSSRTSGTGGQGVCGAWVTPSRAKEGLYLVLLLCSKLGPGQIAVGSPLGNPVSPSQGTEDQKCEALGPWILTTHFFRWKTK